MCGQYEYSNPELYLRQRGELTLIAEPIVIRVNDRSVNDGGVAQLMVAYKIPSTLTNHYITLALNINRSYYGTVKCVYVFLLHVRR